MDTAFDLKQDKLKWAINSLSDKSANYSVVFRYYIEGHKNFFRILVFGDKSSIFKIL